MEDPALQAVHKYQRHPSLLAIREKYKDLNFSFSNVNLSAESTKWIKKFRLHQVSAWNWYYYYSTQREYRYIFSPALLNCFDNIIDSSSFPYHLKLANTTHVNKKHSRNYKRNYRPVSVLSNQGITWPDISKLFENILNQQIFSKQQTRKGWRLCCVTNSISVKSIRLLTSCFNHC